MPNTDARKLEHKEAQLHDDRTLLQEMRTKIKTIINEDTNRYVQCAMDFVIINFALRFPPYVQDAETSLYNLQTTVINDSVPDESIHPHKDRPCIDIPDTVAHDHHDSDNYAD